MKKSFSIFSLVILVMAAMSCGGGRTFRLLEDIEGYIETDPDSAFHAIRKIPEESLSSKREKAMYSLLYAMALDKRVIDTTDISIIAPAVEYFGRSSDREHRMKTMYYAGRIYENDGDVSNAISYYNMALKDTLETDYRFKALIFSSLRSIYNLNYDSPEELRFAELTYDNLKKQDNAKDLAYARYYLGMAYHNVEDFRKADSIFSEVYSGRDSTIRIAYQAMIKQADNALYMKPPQYDKSARLYEYAMSKGCSMTPKDYYTYAYALIRVGRMQEADKIVARLEDLGASDGNTAYWRYRIAEAKGQTGDALEFLKESLDHSNDVVRKQLAQSASKAQGAYYNLLSDRNEDRVRIYRMRMLVIAVCSAVLIFALWVLYRMRARKVKSERERLLALVDESDKMLKDVSEGSERMRGTIENIRKMYVTMYQSKFREIGKYGQAFSSSDTNKMRDKMNADWEKEIKTILKEVASDTEGQSKFEGRINKDLDGVIGKIREDFPSLSEEDIRFLTYVIAGFDNTFIAGVMDLSKENVRVKRSRLRSRILGSEGRNADLYRILL